MTRPEFILLALILFGGARSLDAQQVNPRIPPPPPPAEGPAAAAKTPANSSTEAPATAPAAAAQPSESTQPAAQPIDPTVPPPPPTEDSAPDPAPAPSGPTFDPLHAQRSIDIGTFYLHKGAYDAAIDRFIEASNYQPTLAAPWKLLGETYEKKREYAKAAEAYNKYLRIFPRAADAEKIRKNIEELQAKSSQESSKKPDAADAHSIR